MPILNVKITDYVDWNTEDYLSFTFANNNGLNNVQIGGDLQILFRNPIDYYTALNNRYQYSV